MAVHQQHPSIYSVVFGHTAMENQMDAVDSETIHPDAVAHHGKVAMRWKLQLYLVVIVLCTTSNEWQIFSPNDGCLLFSLMMCNRVHQLCLSAWRARAILFVAALRLSTMVMIVLRKFCTPMYAVHAPAMHRVRLPHRSLSCRSRS